MTQTQKFAAEPRALRSVREFVCKAAHIKVSHPAILVANELAANAFAHTPQPFSITVRPTLRHGSK